MHNRCDLRGVGVRFQPQLILAFIDLLRVVAVNAVRRVPVGVLLGEAADIGVIIPRAEIVGLRLAVVVFAAVAERIPIQRVRLLFHAERIVIVGSCAHPSAARNADRAGCCARQQVAIRVVGVERPRAAAAAVLG